MSNSKLKESAEDTNIIAENKRLMSEIQRSCQKDNVAVDRKIVLIGKVGSGKSAFINTLISVLLETYIPRANCGEGDVQSKNMCLTRFNNCGVLLADIPDDLNNEDAVREIIPNLPHIFDFAGLQDENTDTLKEILKYVIGGYIDPGVTIMTLEDLQSKGIKFEKIFKEAKPELKVKKIIFVHSCLEEVPTNLIQCLQDVTSAVGASGKLLYDVDILLILTKYDRVVGNEYTDCGQIEIVGGRAQMMSGEGNNPDDMENEHSTSNRGIISMDDFKRMEERIAKKLNIWGNLGYKRIRWVNCCDNVGYKCNPRMTKNGLTFLKLMMTPDLVQPESSNKHLIGWITWVQLVINNMFNTICQFLVQDMNVNLQLKTVLLAILGLLVIVMLYNALATKLNVV